MERHFILNALVIIWIIYIDRNCVLSCPTTCKCRGKASKCSTGFTAFPAGLDGSTEYLSISGTQSQTNTISTIGKANFQGVRSLFTLIITFSGVQTVENEAFSYLTNLHDLSLADNDLQNLNADTFKGLTTLRTLDLSGNIKCKIDKTIFTHISNIEELNLGNMDLQKLDKDFFTTLTKLKVLKLYMNGIEKIHADVFKPLKVLETLDLNGNLLLGLPVELKPMFNTMRHVHFSENPWQCNCQLLWLRELPESFVSSRTDTTEIICNGPKDLKYQSFVNIPERNFHCIPPKVVRCEKARYSLDVNHGLTVLCRYEGDPIPEIKFIRPDGFEIDGRETVSGKYGINENGTLTISSVGTEDDGDWTVSAYNSTAHGDMKFNVHVIVTTTSTTTTSTSTTTSTTTTTTTTTATPTTTTKSAQSKSTSIKGVSASSLSPILSHISSSAVTQLSQQPGSISKSTVNQDLLGLLTKIHTSSTGSVDASTKSISSDNTKTVVKESPVNYGLLAAAAAGGGTIVGIICIIVMCCKKKQNNEKNKISPFDDDFDL